MNPSKLLSSGGLLFATLLLLAGVGFVVIYFKDAIYLRRGEVDQSLIFWYLPFLFAGLGSLISGIVIGHSSLHRLKRAPDSKHNGENEA